MNVYILNVTFKRSGQTDIQCSGQVVAANLESAMNLLTNVYEKIFNINSLTSDNNVLTLIVSYK